VHSRARAIIEQLQARNAELEQELEGVARQQPSTVEELTTQDIVAGFSLTEKDARIAELEAELADMGEKLNLAIRGLKERWGVATVLKWWGTAAEDERDEFLAELIAGELSQPEALKAARTLYAP
jgi:hypothetical protein